MTVAFLLTDAGHAPKQLKVTAAVDISKVGEGFAITSIALDLEARVDGLGVESIPSTHRGREEELSGLEGALCRFPSPSPHGSPGTVGRHALRAGATHQPKEADEWTHVC